MDILFIVALILLLLYFAWRIGLLGIILEAIASIGSSNDDDSSGGFGGGSSGGGGSDSSF